MEPSLKTRSKPAWGAKALLADLEKILDALVQEQRCRYAARRDEALKLITSL